MLFFKAASSTRNEAPRREYRPAMTIFVSMTTRIIYKYNTIYGINQPTVTGNKDTPVIHPCIPGTWVHTMRKSPLPGRQGPFRSREGGETLLQSCRYRNLIVHLNDILHRLFTHNRVVHLQFAGRKLIFYPQHFAEIIKGNCSGNGVFKIKRKGGLEHLGMVVR